MNKEARGSIVIILAIGAVLLAGIFLIPRGKPATVKIVRMSTVGDYDPAAPFDPRVLHFGKLEYVPPANSQGLHVFFLGNSLTFVNDLPHMIEAIAASDNQNPISIQVGTFSRPSHTLRQLWNYNIAQSTIQSRHWDYVVLQEASVSAMAENLVLDEQYGVANWNRVIRSAGARPVVYEIWAKKRGSDWYTNPAKYGVGNFISAQFMQGQIDQVTNEIAAQNRVPVIPVGDYWLTCSRAKNFPDLYYNDGTHPSLAGTYLTALIFYHYLTGHELGHITYVPIGLTREEAQLLTECAALKFSNAR